METNKKPTPLTVLNSDGNTIFSHDRYLIPLYQRTFSWSENEIGQMIEDIYGFDGKQYYLGSLIVDKRQEDLYEVIDGQQRLTALFLLLNYLEYGWEEDRLCYECRDKSNYTLNNLKRIKELDNGDEIEESLNNGIKIIDSKFIKDNKGKLIDKELFKEKLKRVKLFRIEVPPHTDLNRYFEIMNVRGEQLEQSDILKAKLMNYLKEDDVWKKTFAAVWDACSDMTGYVQMHFSVKQRKALFGGGWNNCPDLYNLIEEKKKNKEDIFSDKNIDGPRSIIEITKLDKLEQRYDGENEDGNIVRFESIILFPYLLLHTLMVYMNVEDLDDKTLPLDDQKLCKTFKKVIDEQSDKRQFSIDFICSLLKCRFLFDKYIIKREHMRDDKNGKWSLKVIENSDGKPKYIKTDFKNKWEQDNTYKNFRQKPRQDNILMLQSCLRVSLASPKIMHWITKALKWLNDSNNLDKHAYIECLLEDFIKDNYVKPFVEKNDFMQGLGTPHILFHYLDYLLWKDKKRNENQYKSLNFGNFVFEFRNSIEHWYPQHPSGGSAEPWEDMTEDGKFLRDSFGNLCIITREVNSRFANANPLAKKTYEESKKGSLKLRIMSDLTNKETQWREDGVYQTHQDEMLSLLKKACNME